MTETRQQDKTCNADRTQRKYCVYYHAKSGRCSRPADQSTWQSRAPQPADTTPAGEPS